MPGERIYRNGVWTISYEDAWKDVLRRASAEVDEKAFLGGFIDVDDTPRRGSYGVSVVDASPDIFEKYYAKIVKLAAERKRGMVFINAWNEWGEGAYMEPDEDFRYGYLEAIKRVMENADKTERDNTVLDIDYQRNVKVTLDDKQAVNTRYEKLQKYYQLLTLWLKNLEKNKRIERVLNELHISKIAIYGMGDLGKHLKVELEDSSVDVILCFDKRTEFLRLEKPGEYIKCVYSNLDAVIVTPILEYKEIRLYLKEIFDVPIMSLEELIAEAEILQ